MKFITLMSYSERRPIVINVETIGHIYEVEKIEYNKTEKYTVVGTTCHNNGGFKVTQSADDIIDLINPY